MSDQQLKNLAIQMALEVVALYREGKADFTLFHKADRLLEEVGHYVKE